jgi:hypothetical protein
MNRTDEQFQPDESISRALSGWLDGAHGDTHQLKRWLQGYDPPAFGGDDEPYVWLLHALPVGGDYHLREVQLAERAARLLDEQPDVTRPGGMPERLLYNLLFLCSGLHCPNQLAEPLHAMYERRALEGHWLGVELYDALLSALIPNQADNRLCGIWKGMLEGDGEGPLGGNAYDGFEGILWMPKSRMTRGEPDLESLGYALWTISRQLNDPNDNPHRRSEFTALLNKVQDAYFGHPTWKTDLLNLAHKYKWATWAVECLPVLSFLVRDMNLQCQTVDGEALTCSRLLVWWPVAKVLEACKAVGGLWYSTEGSLCNEQVFDVILPQSEVPFIADLASYMESNRRNNPFPSSHSVVGNIAGALSMYESKLGQNHQRSKILERAHKDILAILF